MYLICIHALPAFLFFIYTQVYKAFIQHDTVCVFNVNDYVTCW